MKRILITGCRGQLGFELQRALAPLGEVIALPREQMDLADGSAIAVRLDAIGPDIVVNAAAYTAVDKAEGEAELAMAVNAHGPGLIARWARTHDALMIHYSSDYVFSGDKSGAYVEDDEARPGSVYGLSKWLGEQQIRQSGCRHLILRTSWVYGVHGNNFLKTMLGLMQQRDRLQVVADQIGAPTGAALIADVSSQLLTACLRGDVADADGTYHLTAGGQASWFEYARTIARLARQHGVALKLTEESILPIASHEYPTAAVRPVNSVLNTEKLRTRFGLTLPEWQHGVDQVVDVLAHGMAGANRGE